MNVIGGMVGLVIGILGYFAGLRLYHYLNKVTVIDRKPDKNWVVYYVNEGPNKVNKTYRRTLTFNTVEGVEFYDNEGKCAGIRKWDILTNAVTKYKMEKDI